MKKHILATVFSASIVLAGCATSSQDVVPTYVAPLRYQAYDCAQIDAEAQRLEERMYQLAGRLDQAAAKDKKIAIWGGILFWPALISLGGNKQEEAYFSQRAGEYEALQQVAILRKCPLMLGGVRTTRGVVPAPPSAAGAEGL